MTVVKGPKFSSLLPWYGRLVVGVHNFDHGERARLMAQVIKVAPRACLISLDDGTLQLPSGGKWLQDFASAAKGKGYEVGHVVDCQLAMEEGPAPGWCMDLQQVVLLVNAPAVFKHLEAFNETIQDLWFMEGQLQVLTYVGTQEDLDTVYHLESLVPNDVPFYVQLTVRATDAQDHLEAQLLTCPNMVRMVRR